MAQEKIVIQFQAKGNKALTDAIKQLDIATKRLMNTQSRYSKEGLVLRNVNRGINLSFATLRSNMLLYTFAMGLGVRQMMQFIKTAGDAHETSSMFNEVFKQHAGIVSSWAKAYGEEIGRSDITLKGFLASLQDTLVPLGVQRQEAAKLSVELTQLALDVASFKNASDREVINAFSSALVGNSEAVRKYGIALNEENLRIIAFKNGITDSNRELTQNEKIQARVIGLTQGSADAIGDLKRTNDSYNNTLKRFNDDLLDLQIALGETFMPIASVLMEIGTIFMQTERIKGYAFAVGLVATAYGHAALMAAVFTNKVLISRAALIKTGYGIAILGVGELASRYLFASEAIDEAVSSSEDYKKMLDEINGSLSQGVALKNEEISIYEYLEELYNNSAEAQLNLLEAKMLDAQHALIMGTLSDEQIRGLQVLENKYEDLRSKINDSTKANDEFSSSLKGILGTMSKFISLISTLSEVPVSELAPGFGKLSGVLGFAASFFHQGGLISDNNIQKFSKGGTVNGADNVPIMAQGGEFVMSRRAVDAVGVETMNRINKTGSAGNINVNVSGNVMTQDFVEGELAVAIKKAARRGSDFGLS